MNTEPNEPTVETEKKRFPNPDTQFKVGNPGGPGRPKKRPITELYEEILEDPTTKPRLRAAVESMLFGGRMAGQLQLKEMAERVEGKVTQPVEVNGELSLTLTERMERAEERLKQRDSG